MNRFKGFVGIAIVVVGVLMLIAFLTDGGPDVFKGGKGGNTSAETSGSGTEVVPWDYKIEQNTVGDLINGDMAVLPNNDLLPNDDNYATGDKIYTLQYMSAVMREQGDGRNDVTLSAWKPVKSYKNKADAEADLAELKSQIKTEVKLVGVYKTELDGKFREFAVLTLPSGHTIKQPIDEDRYNAFKSKSKVNVTLEEVHDYANYDMAMAKFRGWAE